MKTYHGGAKIVEEIDPDGPWYAFPGIFSAASECVARSHGDVLTTILSPRPLSDHEINYSGELRAYDVCLEIVGGDEALADAVMDAACPQCGPFGGHEVQALRGKLAQKLGFTSVEVADEHGTSWLCLTGCALRPHTTQS